MSRGAGFYLAPNEKDQVKVNNAVRQLMEGRSNAVGTVTLALSTSTTVTATNCGPNSVVILFPASAAGSDFLQASRIFVNLDDIEAGQFKITHATNGTANVNFMWVCLG